MTFRLSICIPTYNREVYLESLLASIFDQIGDENAVEVVVSDNGSTDDTPRVMSRYRDRPNFRCFRRRDTNAGADRNILDVVAAARGEFCWLFGDDENLAPGAVDTVLRLLRQYEPDLLHVSTNQLLHTDQPHVFESFRDLVESYGRSRPSILLAMTLMTTMIIRRSVWERVPNKESFESTRYLHALVPAVAMRDCGRVVIAPDRVVAVRAQRAPFADERIHFEMRYLHLNYLSALGTITGSHALDSYIRTMRRGLPRASGGDFARLTLRYLRNSVRLLRFTIRALLVRRKARRFP